MPEQTASHSRPRALIAMSGGVDSSVAACLMQEAGFACAGATMRLTCPEEEPDASSRTCCSHRDVEDAERRHNLQNTFDALLSHGVIPVVNENDSVSLAEIESEKKRFSDNDMLGAIVAAFVGAEPVEFAGI